MSSSIEPLTLPHDVEAVYQSLKLDINDPALKRRINDAIAQLVENNRMIEDRGTQTVGLAPVHTTDPANPIDGQFWINGTTGKFRARINGATVDLN